METKGTLLHYTMRPVGEGPGADICLIIKTEIDRKIRPLILLLLLMPIIVIPRSIRTGNYTVFAPNAAAEGLHHDAILPLVRCLSRADGYTRRTITVHAWHWDYGSFCCRGFPLTYCDNFIPGGFYP